MLPNSLDFLRGNSEHGWGVARNPVKVLNHLDFIRCQEQLASRLENDGLSETQRSTLLQEYVKARHIEFHPTDLCNLTCKGCTYGHDDHILPPVQFPFDQVEKLAEFDPLSMVIAGGGEPVAYRWKHYHFPELIQEIRRVLPDTKLALVTNGTFIPAGNWPVHFDWIRVSLDASTPATYESYRGKPVFQKVTANILRYLDFPVKYVGVGFVFSKFNIHEYVSIIPFIHDFILKGKPNSLARINIQFRAFRNDPPNFSLENTVDKQDAQNVIAEVLALLDERPELESFIRNRTNVTAIIDYINSTRLPFARCYYSEVFKQIRANGEIRPCCMGALDTALILGNIRDDLRGVAENNLVAADKRKAVYCNSRECHFAPLNHIIENGLNGELKPSSSPDIKSDPMF